MDLNELYQKALRFEFLTAEEGMYLFENAASACLQTKPGGVGKEWYALFSGNKKMTVAEGYLFFNRHYTKVNKFYAS